MTESHVISGLTAKRSELIGVIEHHQNQIKVLKNSLSFIDSAIKIFDPDYDLRAIKGKQYRAKNSFFKHGERSKIIMDIFREASAPISTSDVRLEVMRRKGLVDAKIDNKALAACVLTILKRLQGNDFIKESSRDGQTIVWTVN